MEDVLMASLEDMAQPQFNTEQFIEEEEELAEPIKLDTLEMPPWPPIELKPLPPSVKYVFLNDNPETPIIISVKLLQDETHMLVTILERHRSAIGYALHDLKGISATICTHCIPTDPDIPLLREHQRRLNNAMWEVVKKEVLKLDRYW